ncbi:MAG: hypothetical protein PWR10_1553 [Halanaerobiales bacterium]|nr:hypothetical protein [Halanaerobiales bacterium]
MNDNLTNMQNRVIRGRILKILKTNYPYPAGEELISNILTDAQYNISPPQVNAQLIYLEEKGYVKMQEADVPGLDIFRNQAKITPKGIDLLEGNIEDDPGVDLK